MSESVVNVEPDEHFRIVLQRRGDDWTGALAEVEGELNLSTAGDGPGWILEAFGQELDRREAERLTARFRETGDDR